MTVREEIAKNLHFYRKTKGITQKDLAAKVGVTNSAISNWEKGLNSIDIDTLHNVCIALDVSISEMFGVYANNPDTLTDFDHTLITAYRAHPEAQASVNKLLDLDPPQGSPTSVGAPFQNAPHFESRPQGSPTRGAVTPNGVTEGLSADPTRELNQVARNMQTGSEKQLIKSKAP